MRNIFKLKISTLSSQDYPKTNDRIYSKSQMVAPIILEACIETYDIYYDIFGLTGLNIIPEIELPITSNVSQRFYYDWFLNNKLKIDPFYNIIERLIEI